MQHIKFDVWTETCQFHWIFVKQGDLSFVQPDYYLWKESKDNQTYLKRIIWWSGTLYRFACMLSDECYGWTCCVSFDSLSQMKDGKRGILLKTRLYIWKYCIEIANFLTSTKLLIRNWPMGKLQWWEIKIKVYLLWAKSSYFLK